MVERHPTRVLMLVENCPYPRDIRVRREAETLARAGLEVSVVAPARIGQPRREVLNQVQVYRYKAPHQGRGQLSYVLEYGYSLMAALWLTVWIMARHGIDIIHAANPPDTFVFIAALFKPFGVRFVYDQHDLAQEMYRARYSGRNKPAIERALRFCERCSYRIADHVVVANASYREIAMRRGGVDGSRISIVRNGPDARQLEHRAEAKAGLAKPGTMLIAYLGLMGVQDGVDHLILALHRLVHDLGREDVRCLLIGSGEEEQNLREMTHKLGLDAYIRFMGFIPDPAYIPYLLAADICVDPDPFSEYNDCSTMVKVMDYMALAKPIVAFDLRETRRSAAGAALYVKPNDELEFAKGLAHLVDHPEQRAAMGAIGRARVEGALSWSASAECLLRAYSNFAPELMRIAKVKAGSGAGFSMISSEHGFQEVEPR